MNLQERIGRYRQRGFPQTEAEILILVLFYGSPRLSRDLDLLPSTPEIPKPEQIGECVQAAVTPLAETLGLGQVDFREDAQSPGFTKQWVLANQKPLFSIDVTTIGGSILPSQIVTKEIPGAPPNAIFTPNPKYLLLQKCETFLSRRHVKARDAFDIHFLCTRGAELDNNLHAHLEDFLAIREIDAESIALRIATVTAKLCTVELRPVLPQALYGELAENDFEALRQSLRTVFSQWLEAAK